MKKKNRKWIFFLTFIMGWIIIFLGPLDIFTQGFYCDEIPYELIPSEDYLDVIDLSTNDYLVVFSPKKNHFAGFEIMIYCDEDDKDGYIEANIFDESGKRLDSAIIDLKRVTASWYRIQTKADLEKDKLYALQLSLGKESKSIPYLIVVNNEYLPEETISGEILLSYAYRKSVFTDQNKIIISFFVIAMWMYAMSCLLDEKYKKKIRQGVCFIIVISCLTWNYMYYSMDDTEYTSPRGWYTNHKDFQEDSELLVTGMLLADKDESCLKEGFEQKYGLGRYFDLKGAMYSYHLEYKTDDEWLEGYSRDNSDLIVDSNPYSRMVCIPGNSICLKNGEKYKIIAVENVDENILVHLDCEKRLNYARCGSLEDAVFYDAEGNRLPDSYLEAYNSQFGLQGKIFALMARNIDKESIRDTLNLFCCIAAAVVFTTIVLLLYYKYKSRMLAGCFLVTFWLSPWIVNFSRNLYWVEFTWFIPIAIGLFCSLKINNCVWRRASYVAAFIAILVKCLCGYEYITVIMLGLISFLVVDYVENLVKKERKSSERIFKSIMILGCMALAGFVVALFMHACLKGNGDILKGTRRIIEQDALRRTAGTELNNLGSKIEEYAVTASVWETVVQYFHFYTQIITGIGGNLFGVLCIIPLVIFGFEYKTNKLNIRAFSMYIIFFVESISWFILARQHSYVHTHMNYVLWYFGYIQICFYVIVDKLIKLFSGEPRKRENT